MSERIVPDESLSPAQRDQAVAALTDAHRRAIALTLEDLRGWGTLHGQLRRYDPRTGEEFPAPRRVVGTYDRRPRPGLPPDWIDLFIRLGWLDIARLANGWTVWKPTAAGAEVRAEWLPDHLKERS
ncbi:hypothetical protein ACFV9C_42885 [Kribbella sp. NPDC059898]|uniref:hypothetical protein n=1 Tax=Kribbella sp. NPDC059898 TaxID=3346995 RepID=UPI00365E9F85